MEIKKLKKLFKEVAAGKVNVEEALTKLKSLPYEDLGFARVDHHRVLRKGFPEVIFGQFKTSSQIYRIARALQAQGAAVLVTRVTVNKAKIIRRDMQDFVYHYNSCCLTLPSLTTPPSGNGLIAIISAGTSDLPIAEEAALTANLMGSTVETIFDVGVSGLHRLLAAKRILRKATCFIVVAGMEGALPSVVAGLVDKPVIAVPTSIGYGTSFGGLAALLGMLNSCAPGLAVVNIDNGFGAGYLAGLIDHMG